MTANHVVDEKQIPKQEDARKQLDLFTDYEAVQEKREEAEKEEWKKKALQHAMIAIKRHKFGQNVILKAANLPEGRHDHGTESTVREDIRLLILQESNPYSDIFDLPHHVSNKHSQVLR